MRISKCVAVLGMALCLGLVGCGDDDGGTDNITIVVGRTVQRDD